MTRGVVPKRLRDLVKLLGSLQRLQGQLLILIQSKIDAMKRADIPAMRDLNDQEQTVVKQLQERDGFRRQLMDAIGEELGLPPRSARALSVSQLASRLPEPARTNLLDAAGRLRGAVSQVAQANRVAGAVSREILNHLKWVFASVRPAEGKPVGYSGQGVPVGPCDTRILETVG